MIGRLTGTLLEKNPPGLLLDVNGVGYELEAPMSTFYALPEVGESLSLHTHMVVREDAQLLYGFATNNERTLFRSLLKVNGVGAKAGLSILSSLSVDEFLLCVANKDVKRLVKVPGIGKKTAERLLIELQDKFDDVDRSASLSSPSFTQPPTSSRSQAEEALVALGYRGSEANRMLDRIGDEERSVEQMIKAALQSAGR